jgi:hypothetical protein
MKVRIVIAKTILEKAANINKHAQTAVRSTQGRQVVLTRLDFRNIFVITNTGILYQNLHNIC